MNNFREKAYVLNNIINDYVKNHINLYITISIVTFVLITLWLSTYNTFIAYFGMLVMLLFRINSLDFFTKEINLKINQFLCNDLFISESLLILTFCLALFLTGNVGIGAWCGILVGTFRLFGNPR